MRNYVSNLDLTGKNPPPLGLVYVKGVAIGDDPALGMMFEAHGVVKLANFSYPGVKVAFNRDINVAGFEGQGQGPAMPITTKYGNGSNPDPSSDAFMDQTPPDIYDLDAVRVTPPSALQSTIARLRANFKEFAEIGGVQASRIAPGSLAWSMIQVGGSNILKAKDWQFLQAVSPAAVAGDDAGKDGSIKLTWDLN